jgi:hypothetical protein
MIQMPSKPFNVFGQEHSSVSETMCWFGDLPARQQVDDSMRRDVEFLGYVPQQPEICALVHAGIYPAL